MSFIIDPKPMNRNLLTSRKPSDATKITHHDTTVVIEFDGHLCSVSRSEFTAWIRKHKITPAKKASAAKKVAKKKRAKKQ